SFFSRRNFCTFLFLNDHSYFMVTSLIQTRLFIHQYNSYLSSFAFSQFLLFVHHNNDLFDFPKPSLMLLITVRLNILSERVLLYQIHLKQINMYIFSLPKKAALAYKMNKMIQKQK